MRCPACKLIRGRRSPAEAVGDGSVPGWAIHSAIWSSPLVRQRRAADPNAHALDRLPIRQSALQRTPDLAGRPGHAARCHVPDLADGEPALALAARPLAAVHRDSGRHGAGELELRPRLRRADDPATHHALPYGGDGAVPSPAQATAKRRCSQCLVLLRPGSPALAGRRVRGGGTHLVAPSNCEPRLGGILQPACAGADRRRAERPRLAGHQLGGWPATDRCVSGHPRLCSPEARRVRPGAVRLRRGVRADGQPESGLLPGRGLTSLDRLGTPFGRSPT